MSRLWNDEKKVTRKVEEAGGMERSEQLQMFPSATNEQ